MLGKSKKKQSRPVRHFDTLISNKTSLTGDIAFAGGLHLDGRIKGNVRAEENSDAVIRISEVGEVEGDVFSPHVIINGTVHGDVYASKHLELASKASIKGNVYYNLIEMAMGAEVNGNLVHQTEPVGLLRHGQDAASPDSEVSELGDSTEQRLLGDQV